MSQAAGKNERLYVSWAEYHRLIETLALRVYESGYAFDSLLCLARGGLRVGDVISRIFERPLAILATSSYREAAGTQRGALDIATHITTTGGDLHGRLLLVDDLVDTGTTLARVVELLRSRFHQLTEVRTAVIWYKAVSSFRPDYHVVYLPHSPWIQQPFEEYDTLRPPQLAARLQAYGRVD
ncbi:MAG: phosphoribosyltransferase [Sutterellaceae bacterium]|nr:phosphoribosyltransferase [Burkholderiaceae bacterium]MCX7900785.1 phosphoribosyltransferase [Burkholderiaceae bacterium]MDW8429073.1 phosphoribosyltransferase [Sutterellaceae bacterium]